jgi:hypothetical protein
LKNVVLLGVALASIAVPAYGASSSVYVTRPDEPQAVTVKGVGDGIADDSAAIQQAIDAAARTGGAKGGIVFLPSGRYRVSRTILLRSAVRVFGIGKVRPVIVLGDDTPGYADGIAAVVSFTGDDQYRSGKPPIPPPTTRPFDPSVFDATQTTFYSALSNVDFELGKGNAGAVAIRFRVAQHAFVRHADFHLGSGLAGIYQAGNECEDLRFFGGRYGIISEKTSPAWPFTLIDSEFEGQRDAAIREHELGLTLVNVAIRNTPVGIEIDRGYSDSLWGKDVRFENVSRAAVLISEEKSVFTQIGFDNAIGINTPTFALFRDSGKTLAGKGNRWLVKDFSYGLKVPALGTMGQYATELSMSALTRTPARRAPAIRALPPVREWANVRDAGANGDNNPDDTAALQRAITAHRVVYLPMGRYRITDTLKLRPDSVVIALHPDLTQITLATGTENYAGTGSAKALVESARGGNAIVSGVGLWAGAINPRATALIWKAGEASLVNDVRIHGPLVLAGGKPTGVNEPGARMDSQHASIWVTDGGGGTFAAIWTPNGLASSGFMVSDTQTPGYVYELSAEHHLKNEIVLRNVRNWQFLGPQTEQEVTDGVNAVSTEFHNSRNILFANYHSYRVTRSAKPMDTAVRLFNSGDIRFRNVHVNADNSFAHCDAKGCGTFTRASKYPFENAIKDLTRQQEVREREFAMLDVPAPPPVAAAAAAVAGPSDIKKLADGFYSIAGGAVDAKGKLYFIDRFHRRIHGWSQNEGLSLLTDTPLDPVNLAVDRSGDLMVLSAAGTDASVYSIDPAQPEQIRVIAPTATRKHANASTLLPVNVYANGEFADRLDPKTYAFPPLSSFFTSKMGESKTQEYVSPDGSLVLPAFRVWNQSTADNLGWRWSDTLDTYGFVSAKQGERVFLTNASENKTYSGLLGGGGQLTDLKIVADRGGESVVRDEAGNLYVANGQVFVYGSDGRLQRQIDTPERPLQLLIGGADKRTLFILAHHALYAMPL